MKYFTDLYVSWNNEIKTFLSSDQKEEEFYISLSKSYISALPISLYG